MISSRGKYQSHRRYMYQHYWLSIILSFVLCCWCSTAKGFSPGTSNGIPSAKGQKNQDATKNLKTSTTSEISATGKTTTTTPSTTTTTEKVPKLSPAPKPMVAASFYQRKLPESCVAFASKAGKKIFASALANSGLKSFFPLIQQL